MQNKKSNHQESSEEWLNLSLGRSEDLRIIEPEPESLPKIFSCNFCMRKFYSPQALGGHQNNHRRERGAVRHYQSTEMAPLVINNIPVGRSIGAKAHSLVHKAASRDGASTARFEFACLDEADDLPTWPGSFRFDPQQPEMSATSALDLNHQQPETSATTALDLNLKL